MDVIHERCAGIDIGKADLKACIRVPTASSRRRRKEVRTFATTTNALLQLRDWLMAEGITVVGMEATGSYWKPVFYLLEDAFDVQLLNARHMHAVPGRKTDVTDAAWIAELVEHGLVRPSFVPPPPIRRLRDLTRYRSELVHERTREAQRLEKLLEDAGIKLSVVASDILGVSGRAMLEALIAGERDPHQLADLAKRRMRVKIPQLVEALTGRFGDHHAFLARAMLNRIDAANATINDLSSRIEAECTPFRRQLERLHTIPGVSQRTAEVIIAETGVDPSQFTTAAHLASWAGVCPGNNESAGRHMSGRTRPGDTWLKAALGEAAMAASRTKNTYLAARYRRVAARRGNKRALVAVAHTILIATWHMLTHDLTYHDLGGDYFIQRQDHTRQTRRLTARLNQLGYQVILNPIPAA
ncbi:IS110 family transposase [Virgisporangium aurantiacum]|uniref:IS110 family transposase n=1 Tax=Virgisporangium aurantiacum TaxID=175570 RepID=UPI00194DFAB7|nr:IS110 family transposase [Virgisporangium aurantiacum]